MHATIHSCFLPFKRLKANTKAILKSTANANKAATDIQKRCCPKLNPRSSRVCTPTVVPPDNSFRRKKKITSAINQMHHLYRTNSLKYMYISKDTDALFTANQTEIKFEERDTGDG